MGLFAVWKEEGLGAGWTMGEGVSVVLVGKLWWGLVGLRVALRSCLGGRCLTSQHCLQVTTHTCLVGERVETAKKLPGKWSGMCPRKRPHPFFQFQNFPPSILWLVVQSAGGDKKPNLCFLCFRLWADWSASQLTAHLCGDLYSDIQLSSLASSLVSQTFLSPSQVLLGCMTPKIPTNSLELCSSMVASDDCIRVIALFCWRFHANSTGDSKH